MRALAAAPRQRSRPAERTAPLEIVTTRPQRRARPRAVHAVATIFGVFAILLAQLMLSIVLSDGAYRISALETQRVELDRAAQVLTESIDALRSPQHLAMNAESLGMVAHSSPAYLRLADGHVLGAPVAAGAGSGLFDGTSANVGNVLLADTVLVAAVAPASLEAASNGAVSSGSTVSMVTALQAPVAVPAGPGAIPAPVTR